MRALQATGNNDPLVRIGEVEIPIAQDNQLLVAVEVFSLNRPDFLWLAAPGSQWRPGIDFVGTVIEATRDGSGPATGSRVMVHSPAGGGGAEFALADSRQAVVLPAAIDSAVAAALPLAGLVALRLVREAAIQPQQRVLITGATGGVGHFAVELAVHAGAEVTALVRPGEDTRTLEQRGAQIIHSLDEVQQPFEIILESIGGQTLTKALAKLSRRGTLLWFGAASGQPVQIDFFSFFPDRPGFTLKHFVYNEVPGDDAGDLQQLLDLVAVGVLSPHLSRQESWEQTAEILKAIQLGTLAGKAVLKVS